MKIKKWWLFSVLGLTSIGTGIFLVEVLIEALGRYGIKGYLIFAIFLVTTIIYILYELNQRTQYKIADEVAAQIAEEYKYKFDLETLRTIKSDLAKHLKDKSFNEKLNLNIKGVLIKKKDIGQR